MTIKSITRPELAQELGISVSTLNQWAMQGRGPRSIRVGRQCVYRRDDVEAFKAELAATASELSASTPKPIRTVLMRLPAVMGVVELSKSTIYAKVAAGTFPAPVKISSRAIAWKSSEIEAWILECVA